MCNWFYRVTDTFDQHVLHIPKAKSSLGYIHTSIKILGAIILANYQNVLVTLGQKKDF